MGRKRSSASGKQENKLVRQGSKVGVVPRSNLLISRRKAMSKWINRFVRDEQGQDLVEYAFLIVFIALVAVVGANQLGISLRSFYHKIGTTVNITPSTVPTPGS